MFDWAFFPYEAPPVKMISPSVLPFKQSAAVKGHGRTGIAKKK